jgi:hypothetical protein
MLNNESMPSQCSQDPKSVRGHIVDTFRLDLVGLDNDHEFTEERSPDILKLRELHDAMDRAVLDAYGWTDLQTTCEFLLDYEDEDEDEDTGSKRKKKKPWRYRWPDDLRDEVLARLLKLNAERAEEERRTGAAAGKKGGRKKAQEDELC